MLKEDRYGYVMPASFPEDFVSARFLNLNIQPKIVRLNICAINQQRHINPNDFFCCIQESSIMQANKVLQGNQGLRLGIGSVIFFRVNRLILMRLSSRQYSSY